MAAHIKIQKGVQKGASFSLEDQDRWVIGNSPEECDILLQDPAISSQKIILEKKESLFFIVAPSKCLVNGKSIIPPFELKEGYVLQIGETEILFSYKDLSPKNSFDAIFDSDEEEEEPDILSEKEEKPQDPNEEDKELPFSEEQEEEEEEDFKKEYGKTAYDTIFEDSDDPENLPFNLMDSSSLLLKVIAGPNAGAEISIQKNRSYIIGKDPNSCDIVFQDVSVSTNHARLSVKEKGEIELEDLGSKNGTFVDGKPLEGRKDITPQNLIQMGTTTFLVIDKEKNAETIYSPMGNKEEEVEEEALETEEEKAPSSWKELIIPKSHLTIAVASFVALFVVFLSFFSLFKSEPIAISEKKAKESIQKSLEKFAKVEFSFNPSSGKLFLVGHVLTPIEHEELLYNIDHIKGVETVEDNIIIDEYVWKSTNDVLSSKESFKGIFLHSPKAGEFILSGFVKTEEDKKDLQDYLNSNFPYLDHLQNEVVVEAILTEEIRSIFLQKGFSAISFQLVEGELFIQGLYNENKGRELSYLVQGLQKLPGIIRVKNIAIPSNPENTAINLSDKYQVSGFVKKDSKDFNIIINGKVLSKGESIDGMTLKEILPNMVLFEKEGISYRVDYTR